MRSYAILGAGALGGLYGGLLAKAGGDVHFLMRSDFEIVKGSGLRVDTPLGDFRLEQPSIYAEANEMPKVDVAIVAWKATSNAALRESLKAVCHDETVVLVLQNGWDVERDAADLVGADRVLGGCCFLCSNKIAPGHIQHLDYGMIAFGEYAPKLSGRITERMQAISDDFRAAKIDMRPDVDLRAVRWKKLVWNIPFNALSVILDADTAELMQDEQTYGLVRDIMIEVRDCAAALGTVVDDSHVEKMLENTRRMVPYDSSMRLDYLAKRPMEVEAILGNPLRAAEAAGYHPTKISMLYQQLSFLNRRNISSLHSI